jgi:hypothetical protein
MRFVVGVSVVCGLLSVGCGELFPAPAPPAAPEPGECARNIDCGGGAVCRMEAGAPRGRCEQVFCLSDADCDPGEACVTHLGQCARPLACTPGDGACDEGEACVVDGNVSACVADDERAFERCSLWPQVLVIESGAQRRVHVHGHTGERVDVDVPAARSADVGTFTGAVFRAQACAGPAPCEGWITAEVGGATCDAGVIVLPPVASELVRTVVTEAASGAPIAGARVVFADDGKVECTTDGFGVCEHAPAGELRGVTAIAEGYVWQSVVGVVANTVALALDREAARGEQAGVGGEIDFTDAPTIGDLRIGVGGLSLSPSLSDRLDWRSVLGRTRSYQLELEGISRPGGEPVLMPDGVTLGIGSEEVKDRFAAFTAPRRALAWGGGRKVRLNEVGEILSALSNNETTRIGSLFFWAWFPFVRSSALAGPREVVIEPGESGQAFPDFEVLADASTFAPVILPSELLQVAAPLRRCRDPLAASCPGRAQLDAVFAVALADAPGYGSVGLGATGGRDADGDGTLDPDALIEPVGSPDELSLPLAPPHNGLERAARRLWVFATDADSHMDIPAPVSGAFVSLDDALTPAPLPALPTGELAIAAGTFAVTGQEPATVFRLRLSDTEGRHDVWFVDDASFAVLPALLPDDVEPRALPAELQAITLAAGSPFRTAGVGASELLTSLVSFASVPCGSGSETCRVTP